MDEIEKQIEDLERELSLTINARKRAREDGDEYHENIYKSEQAKLVEQIQNLKNKGKKIEEKEKPEISMNEEKLKKQPIPPEEPFIEWSESDKKQAEQNKLMEDYEKAKEVYDDLLIDLEDERKKLEDGKISYEEYQKFSLYVIDRYKNMKELYEKITKEEKPGDKEEKVNKENKEAENKQISEETKLENKKDEKGEKYTSEENITKIVYDAKNNVYNYTGQKDGKPFYGRIEASRNLFKKSKNQKHLKNWLGEEGFNELFSGATAKAYKKCDLHVVNIIYHTLGKKACRDYLLGISLGSKAKKENLQCKITYNLSEMQAARKLDLFDKIRISRLAKNSKNVAEVIPQLRKKQLAARETKLLDAAKKSYKQEELKASNDKTAFMENLKTFEVQQPAEPKKIKTPDLENNKGAR